LSAVNAENITKSIVNYIRYDPPHFQEWQCPKRPHTKTIHIDEYIEDMPPV